MEMEACPPVAGKKLWNILRIVLVMVRKGIAKSKAVAEFHLLLKRGKLAAVKAIANTQLALHHRTATNNPSFHSPREDYEFSCTNSPAISHRHRHRFGRFPKQCQYDDVSAVSAVQRVLEMLNSNNNNNNDNSEVVVEGNFENSPYGGLPGFGKSPIGKQLRITDSPFPLNDEEGGYNNQVDVAAEAFIKRFYKQLNSQHNMPSIHSPYNNYHNSWDR